MYLDFSGFGFGLGYRFYKIGYRFYKIGYRFYKIGYRFWFGFD